MAVLWSSFPGFGIIDLETAVPPGDPEFRRHWFLEGSWGISITSLVAVPLLVACLRPQAASGVTRMLLLLAGCGAVAAAVCLDPGFLLLPVAVLLSAVCMWALSRPANRLAPSRPGRALGWPPFAVVGTFLVVTLLFGPDALTPKLLAVLAMVFALAFGLACACPVVVVRGTALSRRAWPLLLVSVSGVGPWRMPPR